jgi:transposase
MSKVVLKKYVVRLDPEERARLEALVGKGKHSAALMLKARILLKADISDSGEGWSDGRIVKALDTSLASVHRVRQRLVEEGLDAALARKPRAKPSIPRIFDGEKEARLITLACSTPPAGHAKWSLRLLEAKVVELGIVTKASDNTIGRTLKKTFSNRT